MKTQAADGYGRVLGAIVLSVAFFLFYHFNSRTLAPVAFPVIDAVFFADSADHVNFFKEGEDHVARDEQHETRHVLYWPLARGLFTLVKKVSGLDDDRSIIMLLSLLATANVILVYLVLLLQQHVVPTAIQFATLYGVMFANVIYFSIPETYVYSTAMIALYTMALTIRLSDARTTFTAVILSVLAGLSGLISASLLSLSLPTLCLLIRRCSPGKFFWYGSMSAVITAAVFFVPRAFLEQDVFEIFHQGSATMSGWASGRNFLNFGPYVSVVCSFLAYSVVAPVDTVASVMKIENFRGYLTLPRIVLFAVYVVACALAVKKLVRQRNDVVEWMWIWVASLALFHVYFAPWDAFLYSVQVTLPVTLLLCHAYGACSFRYRRVATWLAVLALAVNNTRVIHGIGV